MVMLNQRERMRERERDSGIEFVQGLLAVKILNERIRRKESMRRRGRVRKERPE